MSQGNDGKNKRPDKPAPPEPKPHKPAPPEPKPHKPEAKADKPELTTTARAEKPEAKPDKGDAASEKKVERRSETQAPRASDTQAPRKNETGLPGKRLFVEPSLHAIDALDVEAVALGVCSDLRPLAGAAGYIDWRLCGRISELVRRGAITGAAGEKVLLPTLGMIPAKRIFVFGWGEKRSLLDNAVKRLQWMAEVLKQAGVERVAVALPEPANILVGLVEEHLRKALGDKLALVFTPDELMSDAKDTRPIPAAPPG